jgi:unsaturated rhamnogalacturonyl hydrolase
VDVLELIPEGTEGRKDLVEILRGIVDVLPSFADPESGMWYQVLDCPGREGNYLEATCSAMFSYTLLKGVRLGYLDASLEDYAGKVYDGLVKTFITEDGDGLLSINQCCSVGGLGGKDMRMGDYAYYLSEPVRSNDPKGVGPFIWASLEMEGR